jgi:transposase
MTLLEISNELNSRINVNLSISSISKKLGITRKRLSLIPVERNSLDKINKRCIYASEISRYLPENLVFLDETGFNAHTTRSYGYSEKNTKAYKNVPANRGQNVSCMCVITMDGLIAFEYKRGAYNGESFINFIENKLSMFFWSNPEKILIMDNARFHHSRDVLQKLNSLGINHKFLPAYSPQLNPIEEFFSMLKSRFSTFRSTDAPIESNLENILTLDYSDECPSFFRNMMVWLEKARAREHFI